MNNAMTDSLIEYAFDLKLTASIRVKATSFEEAVKMLKEEFDCADANFGAWPNGDPITGEVSLSEEPTKAMLYEPEVCPGCEAIEGEPEWGTVGDGFDGYCASCADKREETGEVEIG